MLHNAQNWVRDYALSLNIKPNLLINLANLNIDPPTFKERVAKMGRSLLSAAEDATKAISEPALSTARKVFTIEKEQVNQLGHGRVEFVRVRRPRAVAALAALAFLPIPGHDVAGLVAGEKSWYGAKSAANYVLNGGDTTLRVGIACPPGESPVIVGEDNSWAGYATISCEDSDGTPHAPDLPNIDSASGVKPNFVLTARVNNYAYFLLRQKAHLYYSHDTATPQTKTIGFGSSDKIKKIEIEPIG
jgi:hypothetical protein